MADGVDLDEVAHDEPPHQDLHCLQNQLFSSLVVKELNSFVSAGGGFIIFWTLTRFT